MGRNRINISPPTLFYYFGLSISMANCRGNLCHQSPHPARWNLQMIARVCRLRRRDSAHPGMGAIRAIDPREFRQQMVGLTRNHVSSVGESDKLPGTRERENPTRNALQGLLTPDG